MGMLFGPVQRCCVSATRGKRARAGTKPMRVLAVSKRTVPDALSSAVSFVANSGQRYGRVGIQKVAEKNRIHAGRGGGKARTQSCRRATLGKRNQAGAACRRACLSRTVASLEAAPGIWPRDTALCR